MDPWPKCYASEHCEPVPSLLLPVSFPLASEQQGVKRIALRAGLLIAGRKIQNADLGLSDQ